jgi:ribosomal protein L29
MSEQNTTTLRALVEQWREIGSRPQRPTGFLICADELEAALAAAEAPAADDSKQFQLRVQAELRADRAEEYAKRVGDELVRLRAAPAAGQVRASLVAEVRREVDYALERHLTKHRAFYGISYRDAYNTGLREARQTVLALPSLAAKETD